MRQPLLTVACLVALAWGGQVIAQQSSSQQPPPKPPEGHGGPPGGPPPEALAACKSLAAGAACSFTTPRGAETGTCSAPEGKPLSCRPKNGPGGPGEPRGAASGTASKSKPTN
nr:hypothetical protein [uncultured Rhodoferax sp.]